MSFAEQAALAAALFSVDPHGLGGVCIHAQVQPQREQWLRMLRELLPATAPLARIPCNIADSRLLGGLDLVATLKARKPVAERGAAAGANGGVLIVSMAERLHARTAGFLDGILDRGEVVMPRDGVWLQHEARVGLVALDEGLGADEAMSSSLMDRFAFLLDFSRAEPRLELQPLHEADDIRLARERYPQVSIDAASLEALCAAGIALGVDSVRLALLASRAARAAASLDGRDQVVEEDVILAANLVLAPRANRLPDSPPAESPQDTPDQSEPQPAQAPEQTDTSQQAEQPREDSEVKPMQERVVEAAQAAIPEGLLARLRSAETSRSRSPQGGRAGAMRNSGSRGRPAGVRSGAPRHARLNVIETLRAAAPWQRLRRAAREDASRQGPAASDHALPGAPPADARVCIEAADFRFTRYRQRSRTVTVFVVDASGSSALSRLAEAKGAVELLLGDCYIRRDQVAVVAFRGTTADLLLPPTRSLVRAKRSLAGLPGGGATPLASAIELASQVALQARRRGDTATLVMLTDGRANVARSGAPGRAAAHADALAAASAARRSNIASLFVDTSPRPSPIAGELANAMGARYVPLPFVKSQALSNIVKAVAAPAQR
jgi:magnesium chelatase subunit D